MEFDIPVLIPYVINMCYMKSIYGCATKVNLKYKILEEIAEQMVYSISEKVQSIHEYCEKLGKKGSIEVFCFENNSWKTFEIDNTMLIIIYIEKYNHYYVESEEYNESEDEDDDDSLSYSTCENTLLLMNLHNEAKQKIYECHIKLCNEQCESDCDYYISSTTSDNNNV